MIEKLRLLVGVGMCAALCGCVIGSGPCLWLQARQDFKGYIHFREIPRSDGVDTVPILILDKTLYVYAPPQSLLCLPATDLQLVGVTEFPDSIGENSHVIVNGKILEGVAQGQYTSFVVKVNGILPLRAPEPAH
jgi:hypothetical protein